MRHALDDLPRRGGDACLAERRWIYERRTAAEARQDLKAWLGRWQGRYGRLCQWVEENLEETRSFSALPLAHHRHRKSTNMRERLNEEIKRRTLLVRTFPDAASGLRLLRALAVEIHEDWIEATRYLDMDLLREQEKSRHRLAEAA
ncbi:MAG: transposase [Bryobacteraceae bacterium]|nr:transposase [Bryobacteraceae bacterium]